MIDTIGPPRTSVTLVISTVMPVQIIRQLLMSVFHTSDSNTNKIITELKETGSVSIGNYIYEISLQKSEEIHHLSTFYGYSIESSVSDIITTN